MPRQVTDDDVGLKVLYEPGGEYTGATIDVVAVHGIGAHPDDTWCKDVNEDASSTPRSVNWLKDPELLPSVLKDARIMRYGYHSQWFGRDALQQNASRVAPDLLDSLKRERKGINDRPLIFIAHSFGGIVLLRTLVIGHLDEKQWPGVFVSTVGIVFFGTPFRGSKALNPASMVAAALTQHESYEVQPDMLHGLEPGTEWLKGLVDDYWRVWRLQHKRTKILCLYEQRASPVSSIVGDVPKRIEIAVTEEEGCLDSSAEEIINRAIPRSHFNMNKFAKPTEHDFQTVCDRLLEMRDEAKSIMEARGHGSKVLAKTSEMTEAQKECLRSLYFPEMNSRRNDIADPAVKTCEWLSQHKVYLEWLEQRHGLLWIKGKPGAGKSTLMRHAVAMIDKQERQENSIVASFFFHGRGSLIQRSPLGLFKSLLHQLLQQIPELLLLFSSLFKKRCETEGAFGIAWDWKERDLQDFFKHNVTESARIRPIILYLDALDECGEEIAINLVDYFDAIILGSDVVDASLSICFSCRHYPLVSLDDGLEICVEDEVNQDIEVYIQNVMWRHINDKSRADETKDELVRKSCGNFQWVVLVVPRVLRVCKRGRYREIKKAIQAIPSALGELYKSLLKEVTDDDLSRTLKLMQWICFAVRPLSLEELRVAIVIDADTPYRSIREYQQDEQYADTDEEMARRVLDLSKGLAEIREHDGNRVVQFNHQSVNDYFLEGGFHMLDKLPSERTAGLAHFRLSRSCIRYITMDEIKTCRVTPFGSDSRGQEGIDLAHKFPFLRYAVTCWIPHAQQVEKEGLSQEDLLPLFHEPSRSLMQRWTNINDKFSVDDIDHYRHKSGTTLLHIASHYNLLSVLRLLLSLGDVDADLEDDRNGYGGGMTPLFHAVRMGHEAAVNLLLERNDVEADSKHYYGDTALFHAISFGDRKETMVKLLLERNDVDADSRDNSNGTPLMLAVQKGDSMQAVVQLLLKKKNVNINAINGNGITPLFWAVFRRQKATVRLLLERNDVEADCRDIHGRTPLSHAAGEGDTMKSAIQLLLKRADVHANSKDENGRTSLSYAAEAGDQASMVLRLLLKQENVDADSKDNKGRTPLSYAAEAKNHAEAVMRLLLERKDVDVNFEDVNGRSPLSYAAEAGDRATMVLRLLLEQKNVDADSKNNEGRTPLSYAAEAKNYAEAIMRLLLERKDVDVNSKNNKGRTPLSYAAKARDHAEAVVRLLLERKDVDVNFEDVNGRSPLSYAAGAGDYAEAMVRLLLERKDVDVNFENVNGRSPLSYADKKEDAAKKVVTLLLRHEYVDANNKDVKNRTSLFYAASKRDNAKTVVRMLLQKHNVKTDSKDMENRTPLFYAAQWRDRVERVVSFLLDVNANFKDTENRTSLFYAAQQSDEEKRVVSLSLERNNVNVDSKDIKNRTPLSYAAEQGDRGERVVRLLLKRKDVDADFKDLNNRTPLSYAASRGDSAETVVRLLLERKDVDADFKDTENRTPLSYAAQHGYGGERVVGLLLERNDVDVNAKDIRGYTPLYYAANSGLRAENVIRLLRTAEVQRSLDDSGQKNKA